MVSMVPEISNTVDSDSNQRHTVAKHRSPSEPAREGGAHYGVVQARIRKKSSPREAPRPVILSGSLCFYLGLTVVLFVLST